VEPFLKYLKAAFINRWNLLAFCGGMAFAMISGQADVAMPLVLAAEAAYLSLVGTHPKFQNYVDVQNAQANRQRASQSKEKTLAHILRSIPRSSYERFEQLRARCLELRQIAEDLKQPGIVGQTPLDSLQLAGLDRLLWVYLRLLFTHHSLALFLERTKVDLIRRDIERLENRLKSLSQDDDSPHTQKIRRTLEDNLKTSHDRLANYEKARANHEFVELEIDRLENKIKSLAEVAVNRQEPDFISGQVDQVATSMLETERTMNELDFVTGLGEMDNETPELLQPPVRIVGS
jgi:phage terminase Nu1 subunit (DNA packaging protein)